MYRIGKWVLLGKGSEGIKLPQRYCREGSPILTTFTCIRHFNTVENEGGKYKKHTRGNSASTKQTGRKTWKMRAVIGRSEHNITLQWMQTRAFCRKTPLAVGCSSAGYGFKEMQGSATGLMGNLTWKYYRVGGHSWCFSTPSLLRSFQLCSITEHKDFSLCQCCDPDGEKHTEVRDGSRFRVTKAKEQEH